MQATTALGRDPAGPVRRLAAWFPRLPRAPWGMAAVAAANVVVAAFHAWVSGNGFDLGQIGSEPADWAVGAKVPSLVAHGEWWRLVTANFLHASWIPHLASNLAGILFAGWVIEYFYGSLRAIVIFLIACFAGAAASFLITPSVSLGASTGAWGLLGALLVHNFRYRGSLPDRVNAVYPALVVLLVMQLVMDQLHSGRVDVAGHAGGLIGGALAAAVLDSRAGAQFQGRRDAVVFPVLLAVCGLMLAYGGYGLARSNAAAPELLRAGRLDAPAARVEQLERVLEQRPWFAEAREYVVRQLVRLNRIEDATRHYRLAVQYGGRRRGRGVRSLGRALAEYHLRTSHQAYLRQEWEASLRGAQEAIGLDADPELTAAARNQFAWVLVDKLERDLDQAEREIRLALAAEPDQPAFIDTLAWVLYKQGRYAEALRTQQQAIAKKDARGGFGDPESDAEYWYHLGAIFEKLHRTTEARNAYLRASAAGPSFPSGRRAAERLRALEGPPPPPPPPAEDTRGDPAVSRGVL